MVLKPGAPSTFKHAASKVTPEFLLSLLVIAILGIIGNVLALAANMNLRDAENEGCCSDFNATAKAYIHLLSFVWFPITTLSVIYIQAAFVELAEQANMDRLPDSKAQPGGKEGGTYDMSVFDQLVKWRQI